MGRFHYQSQLFCENELALPQAQLMYMPGFLTLAQADDYFQHLYDNLNWRQDHIKMFGRRVSIPRQQVWHGEPNCHYRYSGLSMQPQSWNAVLQELRQRCEQQAGQAFNSVLCNLYRDQNDSMGMHADNEPELGPQPVIASLSLGQVRVMKLQHIVTGQKANITLEHGSLLVMAGQTQQYWKHGINKSRQVMGARINLTFRQIITGL